ncbi:MAG TPA: hypothetical protein PLG95_03615 [Methanoculleus sp.]|nr:hypothetical protein [Methanoculleus sp.]
MNRLHCPVCNATEIFEATGGCTGRLYRCKRCGYRGALVIEYDDEEHDGHQSD